jgi:hypothetical protein
MGRAGGRAAALFRGGAPLGGPPSILANAWGPLSILGLYLGAGGPAFRAPLVLGYQLESRGAVPRRAAAVPPGKPCHNVGPPPAQLGSLGQQGLDTATFYHHAVDVGALAIVPAQVGRQAPFADAYRLQRSGRVCRYPCGNGVYLHLQQGLVETLGGFEGFGGGLDGLGGLGSGSHFGTLLFSGYAACCCPPNMGVWG